MLPTKSFNLFTIALLAASCVPQSANSQSADPATANQTITNDKILPESVSDKPITSEIVAGELQKISEATDLDETTRATLDKLYHDTSAFLKQFDTSSANIDSFENMTAGVTEQTAKAKQLLEAPKKEPEALAPDISLEDLQQKLATQQAEVARIRKEAELLTVEATRRQQRLAEIPTLRDENDKELKTALTELAKKSPDGEHPLVSRARRINLTAKKRALEAKLDELTKEQAAYTATAGLLPLQRDLTKKNLDVEEAKLNQINATIAEAKGNEARKLIREARAIVEQSDEPLKTAAQCNVEYAQQLQKANAENVLVLEKLQKMQSRIEALQQDLNTAKARIDAVGLTETLGYMLREKRAKLAKARTEFRPKSGTRDEIRELRLESFELEDFAAQLDDLPLAMSEEWSKCVPTNVPLSAEQKVQMEVILEQRKRVVEKSIQAKQDLFQNKVAFDTAQHNYIRDINEFITFIDKHVLWIRSSAPISKQTMDQLPTSVQWLISERNWTRLKTDFQRSMGTAPAKYFFALIGVVLLFGFQKRFRRIIKETGAEACDRRKLALLPTINSLFATLFLSAVWIAPVLLLGWILTGRAENSDFTIAMGRGFVGLAIFAVPLELLRNVWRDHGLAEAHFGWGQDLSRFFRKHLRWFFAITIPALFVMVVLRYQGDEQIRNSLGRFAALFLFGATAVFLHIIFHPEGVFFLRLHQTLEKSRLYSVRRLIHPLIVSTPVALALLTIVGYYYTAFELGECLHKTAIAITVLLITLGIVMRWLYVRRRKLIRAEAIQRLAAKKEAAATSSGNVIAETVGIEVKEESDTRINSLSGQAQRVVWFVYGGLAIAACWYIWYDVLPAIGIFDRVTVWTVTNAERIDRVTLADLVYSIVTIFLTYISVRNVPGLMELIVLRHSMLDAGARYAVTTIFRYVLMVIGLMTALSFLSIPWSQYGWMVAAVTVGLGFGLQEIVANFVSGLILLLERPVRVGDVVTVDGVSGVVSRIQMRATTITNWDRQELIVPNKDLITGKLLNWSLTNVINRIVLNVGVAYGSDVAQVHSIIEKVVKSHEMVLEDPAPLISFEQMGDNALAFVVRCYLSGLDHRVRVTHELNSALITALTSAGISIPFPQRDLHIRAIPQELIDRLRETGEADSDS